MQPEVYMRPIFYKAIMVSAGFRLNNGIQHPISIASPKLGSCETRLGLVTCSEES